MIKNKARSCGRVVRVEQRKSAMCDVHSRATGRRLKPLSVRLRREEKRAAIKINKTCYLQKKKKREEAKSVVHCSANSSNSTNWGVQREKAGESWRASEGARKRKSSGQAKCDQVGHWASQLGYALTNSFQWLLILSNWPSMERGPELRPRPELYLFAFDWEQVD